MSIRDFTIYYNVKNGTSYLADTTESGNSDSIPFMFFTEKVNISLQYINSESKDSETGLFDDFYTGFSGTDVYSTVAIDDNHDFFVNSALTTDLVASTPYTTITLTDLSTEKAPRVQGSISLINTSYESETVNYYKYTADSEDGTYTFYCADADFLAADFTPTYSYTIAGTTVRIKEPPLLKTSDIDNTDKDTGLFVVTLEANNEVLFNAIRGSSNIIDGVLFEHQVFQLAETIPEFVSQLDFQIKNIIDFEGVIAPANITNYLTIDQATSAFVEQDLSQYALQATLTGSMTMFVRDGSNSYYATLSDIASFASSGGDYKGWYVDETALTAAYPTGSNGYFAILGSTDTVWVWSNTGLAWVNTNSDTTYNDGDAITIDASDNINLDITKEAEKVSPDDTDWLIIEDVSGDVFKVQKSNLIEVYTSGEGIDVDASNVVNLDLSKQAEKVSPDADDIVVIEDNLGNFYKVQYSNLIPSSETYNSGEAITVDVSNNINLEISKQVEKVTLADTDMFVIEEAGGEIKYVTKANLITTSNLTAGIAIDITSDEINLSISKQTEKVSPATDDKIPIEDSLGDTYYVQIGNLPSGSGGGGLTWSVITNDITAVSGNGYFADSSSNNIDITLPLTPSEGNSVGVKVIDNTNTITLFRNGSLIEGIADDVIIDFQSAGFTLVYDGGTKGWTIVTELTDQLGDTSYDTIAGATTYSFAISDLDVNDVLTMTGINVPVGLIDENDEFWFLENGTLGFTAGSTLVDLSNTIAYRGTTLTGDPTWKLVFARGGGNGFVGLTGSDISFDNTGTTLTSTNIQDALVEIYNLLP